MTSNAPSYPEMPFAVLSFFLKTTSWTLASLISVFLGAGWAKGTQMCLCCGTCLEAQAGRGFWSLPRCGALGRA